MEEADARLQEVLASLLNEHGGHHEPVLRQTFACLHNSGLYEAQSVTEEEQRGQQVLAIFRSFPFRAPAAPIDDGAGSLVEETQAPQPPSYSTIMREPEEAGEVTPAQPDPENVGEDAATTQSAPEALLPLNPGESQEDDRTSSARPEVSHQGATSAELAPATAATASTTMEVGSSLQEDATAPEGFSAGGFDSGVGSSNTASAAAAAATAGTESLPPGEEGVEETKGGAVWDEPGAREGVGFEGRAGIAASTEADQYAGGGSEVEGMLNGGGNEGVMNDAGPWRREYPSDGDSALGNNVGSADLGMVDARNACNDPESTRQNQEQPEERHRAPQLQAEPPVNGEQFSQANGERGGGGGEWRGNQRANLSSAGVASAPVVTPSASEGTVVDGHNSSKGAGSVAATGAAGAVGASSAAGAGTAPKTTAVTEPHLKTAGQPLKHTNTVKSPKGVSTDLQSKLRALKLRRKHRFLVMRIEGTEVVSETVGPSSAGPEELRAALPFSDCRYAVYDQEILTPDGRKTNKLFFFSWLPHNATPQNKMVYLYGKVTVKQRLEGVYDVAANMFEDVEVALGLEQDEEDSDIDFDT